MRMFPRSKHISPLCISHGRKYIMFIAPPYRIVRWSTSLSCTLTLVPPSFRPHLECLRGTIQLGLPRNSAKRLQFSSNK